MSKNQMTAACGLGAWVLAAAALGWFYYSALDERQTAEEDFDSAAASIDELYNSAIFPNQAAIDAVKSNETAYAEWRAASLERASRGDKVFEEMSGVQFKQTLIDRVGELRKLPGGTAEGTICAATFDWGFGKLLAENAPLPQRQETPRYLAQLAFVTSFAGDIADAGVVEINSVICKDAAPPPEDPKAKRDKAKSKKKAEETVDPLRQLDFEFVFLARPQALIKVLNGLVRDERFVVVTSFTFKPVSDTVMSKLSGGDKKEDQPRTSKRRRSRGAADEAVAEEEEKKDILIFDPETGSPLQVTLKLSVYDFGKGGER